MKDDLLSDHLWMTRVLDIRMEDIFHLWNLSEDLEKLCAENQIITVRHCLIHYLQHNGFSGLRGATHEACENLVMVCAHMLAPYSPLNLINLSHQLIGHHNNSSSDDPLLLQLDLANYHYLVRSLSVRAQNVLKRLLHKHDGDISGMLMELKLLYPDISQLPQVGVRTSQELCVFIDTLTNIQLQKAEPNFLLQCEEAITQVLGRYERDVNAIVKKSWVPESSKIDAVKLVSLLIDNYLIVDRRQALLLRSHTEYFLDGVPRTCNELADSLQLSRERIRQLTRPEQLIEPFWHRISELLSALMEIASPPEDYGLDMDAPIILLDTARINALSGTSFSHVFLTMLFDYMMPGHTTLVDNSGILQNPYLIRVDVATKYDWISWIGTFRTLTTQARYEMLTVDIRKNISLYKQNEAIRIVCDTLLREELKLTPDGGKVSIPIAEPKGKKEKLYLLLRQADTPLHLRELHQRCQEKYPDTFKDMEAIRAILLSQHELFALYDKSTYGLLKWNERPHLHAGTIKSVIIDFLTASEEPQHLWAITKYVTRFRATNLKSISGLINLDGKNTFVDYGSGFFGLATYASRYSGMKYNPIPNRIAHIIRKRFLRKYDKRYSVGEIIDTLSAEYQLLPVQVEYVLHHHATNGKWELTRGKLTDVSGDGRNEGSMLTLFD